MCKNIGNSSAATHKMSNHPIYTCWRGIKQRCRNPNHYAYKNWGGRGIKLCERWDDFHTFYEDVKDGYRPGLSLDRIDNDGDYEPSNVRWATHKEQGANMRRSAPKALIEQLESIGLNYQNYKNRLSKGWSEEASRTTPKLVKRNLINKE